jgi:hypothetical protein
MPKTKLGENNLFATDEAEKARKIGHVCPSALSEFSAARDLFLSERLKFGA